MPDEGKGIVMNIGITFKDQSLLEKALTHSSYAHENKKDGNNERLEFLGDSILDMIISEYVFRKFPKVSEGELTKIRAATVCEKTLCEAAREIGLGEGIQLSKGEASSGGHERSSILADAFEAVIAAIYLDQGMPAAEKWVLDNLAKYVVKDGDNQIFTDYKTTFQEIVQDKTQAVIRYELSGEKGPEHSKVFISSVYVGSKLYGQGEGVSKKASEQEAARAAIEEFERGNKR